MATRHKKRHKKKELVNTFVPDNEQQSYAIEAIQDHVDKGNPNFYLTLQGKAGTGKTTLIEEAISPYVFKKNVVIAALSHKAKLVLAQKVNKRFGQYSIGSETIASLLGMKMDNETGHFTLPFGKIAESAPIKSAEVLVIDECSMVNEEAEEHIMKQKPADCKVIFVGDIGQLPPIRDNNDSKYRDKPSPVFATSNKAKLIKRVRQSEESPILPYADLFWNNSQVQYPEENPAAEEFRKSIVTNKGSLVFSHSRNGIDSVIDLYKLAVETGNQDIVRAISYTNKTRQIINNRIRKALFGEKSEQQFVPGELIIFSDNYEGGDERIYNSTEVQVKDIGEDVTKDNFEFFNLGVSIDGKPRDIPVLARHETERWSRHLNNLAEIAKETLGRGRGLKWKEFYEQKERFAPIEYGYAITSHKCQGSSYDVALIAEADIIGLGNLSSKTKSQSIYTAITRAKHLSIIMDGRNDHPEQLSEAIKLLHI